MTYEVRILGRAQADLREIGDYIAGDSETYAVAMVDRVLDRIEKLSEFPHRGARPRDERLRQSCCEVHNHCGLRSTLLPMD